MQASLEMMGETEIPKMGLRTLVRRAERRHFMTMLALMAPSVIFVALLFVIPILLFLFRSVDNAEIPTLLPKTAVALDTWRDGEIPGEPVFAALASDLHALKGSPDAALLGRRLNFAVPGYRRLITRTVTSLPGTQMASAKETLAAIDKSWLDPVYWRTLKSQSGRITDFYLLSALDLQRGAGGIEKVSGEQAIFMSLYGRTLYTAFGVTALCLLIGYPVAAVMAAARPAVANWLLSLVLIPFWTSLLVRTTAWVVLLQTEGLVNKVLLQLGVISEPLKLMFNTAGVFIAMVHVLLPYMILPVYSVMKGISPVHLRAAASLGANPATVFRTVYLPLTIPGVAAGCTLVFVLSLGFYVTPALVGGPGDQMIGYFIAYFTNSAVNWGLASALGVFLLLLIGVIYLALGKLVGFDKLKVR
ncbi:ABC transporter permease [Microvirga sp. BT689]|uniref:ABC transporter permease n=1 Tax=Microvirga arvi TaxID=2778731 RepID=UPI001951CCF0|nr:ABC transporter permease [Microvirga arvi]MBM6583532.1 ABC transporter permease [Microvirga arvi]